MIRRKHRTHRALTTCRTAALVVLLLAPAALAKTPLDMASNGLQGESSGGNSSLDVSGDSAASSIGATLTSLWKGFFEHLPMLVAGAIVIVLTVVAAKVSKAVLGKILGRRRMRTSLKELITQLTYILIWTVGLLIAAMVVFPGLTPTKALGGLGLLSVAVSLAFKDIFQNFFAGVLLLWRFPFEPGDFIECDNIVGRVEDITIRMTRIRKVTDELTLVPNSQLVNNPVDVLTDKDHRRLTIISGVAYDVHSPTAVDVIRKALGECKTISSDHDVQIFPKEFGSSSMNIEVTWWAGATPFKQRESRGEVVTAVKLALDEAGLEIPFPYRTLTFKEPLPLSRGASDSGESAE